MRAGDKRDDHLKTSSSVKKKIPRPKAAVIAGHLSICWAVHSTIFRFVSVFKFKFEICFQSNHPFAKQTNNQKLNDYWSFSIELNDLN